MIISADSRKKIFIIRKRKKNKKSFRVSVGFNIEFGFSVLYNKYLLVILIHIIHLEKKSDFSVDFRPDEIRCIIITV